MAEDLRALFDKLDAKGVEDFVANRQEEHLLLDFKLITKADLSSTDDKKNLAKALSGFANSSGGLIVWGVDARRAKSDEPDVACGLNEIASLSTFVSRLNELTAASVRPFVDGVEHRAIPVVGDRGYAATLVPESELGPHMALAGENRYYKRSGDSFRVMEHFDVADMFGRRRRPALALLVEPLQEGSAGVQLTIRLALGIFNSGRGVAKYVYLALRVHPPYQVDFYGLDGNRNEGMPKLVANSHTERRYGGDSGIAIHPGHTHLVTAIRVMVNSVEPRLAPLVIDYDLAAEDVPLTTRRLSLTGEELLSRIRSVVPTLGYAP